jgi:hypothetical protein
MRKGIKAKHTVRKMHAWSTTGSVLLFISIKTRTHICRYISIFPCIRQLGIWIMIMHACMHATSSYYHAWHDTHIPRLLDMDGGTRKEMHCMHVISDRIRICARAATRSPICTRAATVEGVAAAVLSRHSCASL